MQTKRTVDEFKNEPFTDFTVQENRVAMEAAIAKVREELGREYPVVINGKKIELGAKSLSINPAKKEEVVGVISDADSNARELVEKAIEAAGAAFETWRMVPAEDRAEYLFKAAEIIRARKHFFSAWMIFEVGKTWAEADGDTAEAIDFLEFYGREMIRWSGEQPVTPLPYAEKNDFEYIPLGVGAIIPPWNFPLAIMAGMTMSAVVTGNTTILKPSPDSPVIAYKFFEVLREVGLPDGVVNFVAGSGTSVGEELVAHPKTRFISVTGSKAVGLHIYEESAKTRKGQKWMKRVVAEMGGKVAIVVADDANLDEAAQGVVALAFGLQGQKCSACSRLIVDETVHDELVDKVVALTTKLKVDNPVNFEANLAAVINSKSFEKATGYIEKGVSEGGKFAVGGVAKDETGYYIPPTVVTGVKPGDTIEQEEIFAPVLAVVIKAKGFDDALGIANGTEYGLTGPVYSQSEERLRRARRDFHVGNLYLNRKCTGALVGVHPFGGFNMSGTDLKVGGREYLLQFMQGKSVAEKT